MLYRVRVSHSLEARDVFIRKYEDGIMGLVHDPKLATRYDSPGRARQDVQKIVTEGQVRIEEAK